MNTMSFQEVVGHTRQVEWLRRAVQKGIVPHALLITGIAGIGKRTLAWALTRTLLCKNPERGDACGSCSACRKQKKGFHPDAKLIETDARFIRIEQIRDVKRAMMFRPVMGEHRVVLLFEAQRMTLDAANALLKTLEEPPPGNFLILTVPDDRALLPTIVSRCRRINLSPLPDPLIAEYLERKKGVDPDRSKKTALLSGGSLGRALRQIDSEQTRAATFFSLRSEVIGKLQHLKKNDIRNVLFLAKTWSELEDDPGELLDLIRFRLRDCLLIQSGIQREGTTSSGATVESSDSEEILGPERIFQAVEVVETASRSLRQNANRRLVLENLLLHLRKI